MEITIYHNPKCELLNERDLNPTVIEYLTNPPSHQQLDSLLRGLEMEPRDFMRRGETEYAEQNLDDESLSRDQLIAAMINTPKLIQRPVVIAGDQIVIGRPPEAVLTILP